MLSNFKSKHTEIQIVLCSLNFDTCNTARIFINMVFDLTARHCLTLFSLQVLFSRGVSASFYQLFLSFSLSLPPSLFFRSFFAISFFLLFHFWFSFFLSFNGKENCVYFLASWYLHHMTAYSLCYISRSMYCTHKQYSIGFVFNQISSFIVTTTTLELHFSQLSHSHLSDFNFYTAW